MSESRILQAAFAISLLLHVLLAAATWKLPFLQVDVSQARPLDREVELLLVPDDPVVDGLDDDQSMFDPSEIRGYTSVPERMASEMVPEQPDYLAMHHSIASDNVLGGEGDQPSAERESEMEAVAIRKEELGGSPGVQFTEQPLAVPVTGQASAVTGAEGEDQSDRTGESLGDRGRWSIPEETESAGPERDGRDEERPQQPELAEWWSGQSTSVLQQGEQGASGDRGFEFDQMSSGTVTSGIAIDGNFSLNTYEWDYAPWMKRFGNQLHRVWMAPYAYRVGIISGKTVIRVVIEKNGTPSSMEVIETEGHDSLHEASLAALKAFAPYAPLPAHFPEDRLVITMVLLYPAWKR